MPLLGVACGWRTSENFVKTKFGLPHSPGPEGLPSGRAMIRPGGIIRVLCTAGHEVPLSVHKKPRRIGPGPCELPRRPLLRRWVNRHLCGRFLEDRRLVLHPSRRGCFRRNRGEEGWLAVSGGAGADREVGGGARAPTGASCAPHGRPSLSRGAAGAPSGAFTRSFTKRSGSGATRLTPASTTASVRPPERLGHRTGAMQDPACALPRTPLPRTTVNKGIRKGRVHNALWTRPW